MASKGYCGSLWHIDQSLKKVGWFVPPYTTMQFLYTIAKSIEDPREEFGDADLQAFLAHLHSPENVACMVVGRYPFAPIVRDFQITISEAVKAHFLGLHHISVAGLAPAVEGISTQLLKKRGLRANGIKNALQKLGEDCAKEASAKRLGEWDEVAAMLESFTAWCRDHFYEGAMSYPRSDGTNRNGILHGTFSDAAYGSPLNFYKVLSAVDSLTFMASFGHPISWMAPSPSEASNRLARDYRQLIAMSKTI